jgi:siroheme decarboxylase
MGYHDKRITLSEETAPDAISLTTTDLQLLNAYQKEFPLVPKPYAMMAEQVGLEETQVIRRLEQLKDAGIISRIGVVLKTGKAGTSTLAAVEIPKENLEQTATMINRFPEVNHNYEREHQLNLWFVVTASCQERLTTVLAEIEAKCGSKVHVLPMLEDYHIDLGFPI